MLPPGPGLKVQFGGAGHGPYEALVDVAQVPTFPLFRIVLEETNKMPSADLTLLVSPSVHKYLVDVFRTDKVLFYLDIPTGRIQAWTGDMLESIRILTESKVMSKGDQWILKARSYVSNVLAESAGPKAGVPYEGEDPLKFLSVVLDASGLLPRVDSDPKLLAVASDLVRSGRKDFDSCVYRLAMALYHAGKYSGQPVIREMSDPGSSYLGLVSSSVLREKYPDLLKSISEWPQERRTDMTKTFICFCIAAYLCHRAAAVK